ncbi:MAG: O-antigen ligase family protein [bacterium]
MTFRKYVDKLIELSLIAIVILVPIIFYTRTNDVFEINKLFVMKMFIVIIAAAWLFTIIRERKILLIKTNFDFPIIGYFLVCLITTIVTKSHNISIFGVYEDFEGIITICFYIMLYYVVVNHVKKQGIVYKLMTAMLVSTFIISAYGLAQNFGFDFVMWNPETYSKERFFSTLGNPNFLAAYLVEMIPVIFIMFFITKNIKKKIIILVVLLCAIIVLFLTKSRAGILSFIVTTGIIIAYAFYDSKKSDSRLFSGNKIWFIMFAVLMVLMCFVPKVQEAIVNLWQRSKGLFTLNGITLTPRVYIWKSALMMFRDFPLFGTGLDTFQVMFPYYRFPIYWQLEWNGTPEKTHNIFLQVLATQGIFGMSIYLLLLVAFFKKSFNSVFGEKDTIRRYLIFAVFLGIIGFLVQGLFNYTVVAYGMFFWIGLGLIIVLQPASKKYYAIDISGFTNRGISILFYTAVIAGLLAATTVTTREWMSDMYYKVGNIAGNSDKDNIGVAYYNGAVTLNPNCELYFVKYGIAFEKLMRVENDLQKKLDYIKKAAQLHGHTMDLNSMNGYNFNNLARVYKYYGETIDPLKFQDSIKFYNEAIKRDPNNAYFGLDLANVYIDMKDYSKAYDICLNYTKIYPDFAVPYTYIAYLYMLQGPKGAKEAIFYYEQAVNGKLWYRDSISETSAYSNLGIIYLNEGMTAKGADMFERVVKSKPDYIDGWINLARLYELMKKSDKAANCYEQVLMLNPADTRASIPLAALKKRLNR